MMEEEERKCKEEKRKVDSSKTILRKEKGLVSSVMIKEMVIHDIKQKSFAMDSDATGAKQRFLPRPA